jgi:hypothetical protein
MCTLACHWNGTVSVHNCITYHSNLTFSAPSSSAHQWKYLSETFASIKTAIYFERASKSSTTQNAARPISRLHRTETAQLSRSVAAVKVTTRNWRCIRIDWRRLILGSLGRGRARRGLRRLRSNQRSPWQQRH